MDYRALLKRYMELIIEHEGTPFFDYSTYVEKILSVDDIKELYAILEEIDNPTSPPTPTTR